uniref:G-protein coupled receptors family 1 profile domain-containing protein n=2 Tax=Gopherus TaxID=38771 RepID=A0A8C4Y3A2_9SAUR
SDTWSILNVSYFPDLCYFSGLQKSMHILSMVVYSIACLLGVTGNGLVIWIAGFKMKKTVNAVWFLNLAVADFIFTFFLPFSIAYTALGFHWPFGKLLCKLNSTVAFLNMFASVFLLTVISIDRCISVICPVWSRNNRTPKLASNIALVTWVLAFVISSPYLVFRDTATNSKNVTSCYNNFVSFTSSQTIPVISSALLTFCTNVQDLKSQPFRPNGLCILLFC